MSFRTNRRTKHKFHLITDKITARERIEIERERLDNPIWSSFSEREKIRKRIRQLEKLPPDQIVNMIGEVPKA